jgi:hypothetical protein
VRSLVTALDHGNKAARYNFQLRSNTVQELGRISLAINNKFILWVAKGIHRGWKVSSRGRKALQFLLFDTTTLKYERHIGIES